MFAEEHIIACTDEAVHLLYVSNYPIVQITFVPSPLRDLIAN